MTTPLKAALLALPLALAACATSSGADRDQTRYVTRGLDAADESVASADAPTRPSDQNAPLTIDGRRVPWSTIEPLLAEAAGADVVDEVVLSAALEAECRNRNIIVTQSDVNAERALLIDTLTSTAPAQSRRAEDVERLIDRLRRQRGLGPNRWAALLKRNAMLRALVRDQVTISESDVQSVHDRLYGPDYPARLILTPSAPQATEARRRLAAGEPFGVVAAQLSTDPSADRGGIIPPINTADPTWPLALRRAVEQLNPGDTSEPILLDDGYAIIWLERAPDPKHVPAVSAVRSDLERLVRLEQERLLMQREAQRLLDETRFDVIDPALEWSRRSRAN